MITVGRYTEPQFAELMVKEGRADLVAFGRQSLADPAMPKKAQEERLEDMTPCIACLQGCVANMYAGNPVCCLKNPFLGHEAEPLEKEEEPKKVMVIGGGVAGLSAAFIAKERGHEVTLYEAGDVLGGNMRLAAYPPGKGDITNMIRSYIHRCQKDGVKIVMNCEVTPELIKEEKPDSVIIATGSKTLILHQIYSVLVDHVCTYGITELDNRVYLMKDFEDYGIKEITGAKVCKFYEDGVEYETADGVRHESRGYDSVILSMGFRNYNPLEEKIKDLVPETHVIGDAIRARRALDATKEAYEVASRI